MEIQPGDVFVSGDSDDLTFTTTSSITDGNWHFVAVTTNGTSATVYVDGTSLGTQTFPTVLDTVPAPPGFVVGGYAQDCCGGFDGDLADVAVFPAALTAAQVAAQYSASGLSAAKHPARIHPEPRITLPKWAHLTAQRPPDPRCQIPAAATGGRRDSRPDNSARLPAEPPAAAAAPHRPFRDCRRGRRGPAQPGVRQYGDGGGRHPRRLLHLRRIRPAGLGHHRRRAPPPTTTTPRATCCPSATRPPARQQGRLPRTGPPPRRPRSPRPGRRRHAGQNHHHPRPGLFGNGRQGPGAHRGAVRPRHQGHHDSPGGNRPAGHGRHGARHHARRDSPRTPGRGNGATHDGCRPPAATPIRCAPPPG